MHPVNVTAFFVCLFVLEINIFFLFFSSQREIDIGFRVSFDDALDIISRH